MKLQHLENLRKVAELGSISEAAKQLYLSQSSISSAIKNIEAEYGINIFERTSKGVTLTREGEELLIDLERILNEMKHIEKKYSKRNIHTERFCVSSQHHINSLDAYLDLFRNMEVSDYRLGFLECKTKDIFENIGKGVSDIGVIYYTERSKSAMIQELRTQDLVFNHLSYGKPHVYLRAQHPLSHKESVATYEIIDYPFITYDQMINSTTIFTEPNTKHHNISKIIYANDRAVAYSIINSTNAYLVGSGYNNNKDIITIPIEDEENIEIGWVSKINFRLSGISEQYIRNLMSKFGKIHPID